MKTVKMYHILKLLVLIHFHIINNDYQQDSRTLYTFDSTKSFNQLLNT